MSNNLDDIVSITGTTIVSHAGDAGRDLTYDGVEDIIIQPWGRATIPTGVKLQFHNHNYVGLVCPRSGLAFNHGITVTNAPGVVDAGFTGEVKVSLTNLSGEPFVVRSGDRIAQLVFTSCIPVMGGSVRGQGGFGSTGV